MATIAAAPPPPSFLLLLLDDFQKRQGFPFDVLVELGNLKSLYDRYNLHEGARRPRSSANLPVRR